MICDFSDFVDNRLEKVATQYRESPNLKALMRILIQPLTEVGTAICETSDIDIDTATGDQLTLIGKALGWPRVHCAGIRQKIFGFQCEDDCFNNIGGFCDPWSGLDCGPTDLLYGEYEFTDDELYRRFLKALVVKYDNDFTRRTMLDALYELFGEQPGILKERPGQIDIFSGRELSSDEYAIAHLFQQVLPVAPGVAVGVYQTIDGAPFGFGDGWGGFCTSNWPEPIV